jgi:hypothetical protein
VFTAYALGVPVTRGDFTLADAAWNISGAGLLLFGVWLALYVDGYELWDGWILGALVLFGATAAFGDWARRGALAARDAAEAGRLTDRQVNVWHWLRTLSVVAILVLMVWKPGA